MFSDLPDIGDENNSIQEFWARKNQIQTLNFKKLESFKKLKMIVMMHNRKSLHKTPIVLSFLFEKVNVKLKVQFDIFYNSKKDKFYNTK